MCIATLFSSLKQSANKLKNNRARMEPKGRIKTEAADPTKRKPKQQKSYGFRGEQPVATMGRRNQKRGNTKKHTQHTTKTRIIPHPDHKIETLSRGAKTPGKKKENNEEKLPGAANRARWYRRTTRCGGKWGRREEFRGEPRKRESGE